MTTWRDIPGWFDFQDAYDEIVARLAGLPRPAVLAEVGCWMGRSTAYLGQKLLEARRGRPTWLYAVDTWEGSPSDSTGPAAAELGGPDAVAAAFAENMRAAGLLGPPAFAAEFYLVPLRMKSTAVSHWVDNVFDAVFIDAEHTRDAVAADIAAWWPKVRPGGVIAGHDYDHCQFPGVREAVDAAFGSEVRVVPPSCWWVERP